MKYLLEILGMTNMCNLECSYCDWKKLPATRLSKSQIDISKKHLYRIKWFVDSYYKDVQIVEYSGGEPLIYPEIVECVLDAFSDKWVRIVTNGTLITKQIIATMRLHGKAFFAFSLDGNTESSNRNRFKENSHLFEMVLNNLSLCMESGVPVMLLCTLNPDNIESFGEFLYFLDTKYGKHIENGMLALPAHYISRYSIRHPMPSNKSKEKFAAIINASNSKLINGAHSHYESLLTYMKKFKRIPKCEIHEWLLSFHFLEKQITTDGVFKSFGCGMRGIEDLGTYNVNIDSNLDDFRKAVESVELGKKMRKANTCHCFVDWTYFDLIFNKKVPWEIAEKWFVLFRDPKIKRVFT
jgi:MoaA/NifB/PqqE/SkfB family radical SAM enzyme